VFLNEDCTIIDYNLLEMILSKFKAKQTVCQNPIILVLGLLILNISVIAQSDCDAEQVFIKYTGTCEVYDKDFYCINADLTNSISANIPTTTFIWLMGDGNKKTGKKIQHCYKGYGKYTITLLAKSYVGKMLLTDTTYHEVDISNFAIFSPQRLENKQFYFDASEAFIDNSFQIKKYYWDFGDGNFKCGGMNPLAYHQYEKIGSYEIRMIVEGENENGEKKWVCGMQKVRVF
jgi:hypothetical protein